MPTIQRPIQMLKYIQEYVLLNDQSPKISELKERFGFKSTATVAYHLQTMENRGWIKRERYQCRGIRVIKPELGADKRKRDSMAA